MPRKISKFALTEQPIHWSRAFGCGAMSAAFMMAFIDIFNMMGITPFSFEVYIGSLFLGNPFTHHSWTVGFILNLILGGLFGIFYGYCFEYIFRRAESRLGIWVGVWHVALAGVAFFPFFNVLHEEIRTGLYPQFGLLGWGLGAPTPLLLIMGHLLFGANMGLFYGPVRSGRVRARMFEPGETGVPVPLGGVSPEEDAVDRQAV